MSATHAHGADSAAMAHHDDHDPSDDLHVSLSGYLVGFALSVLLTAIPFWLVMSGVIDSKALTTAVITGFAVVQIVVHMIFFLHLNGKLEQGWTMLATLFTLILVVITLSGSLWVMYHLNTNMHPVHDVSELP